MTIEEIIIKAKELADTVPDKNVWGLIYHAYIKGAEDNASVFRIENAHDAELNAIANDESLTAEQRADKYLDFILDRMED